MTTRAYASLACAALLLAGCGNLFEPAAAVVDGEKIPESRVEEASEVFQERRCERLEQQGLDRGEVNRQFEQGYLAQLIKREILSDEAATLDVEVTDDEVQERLDDIKADLGTEERFQSVLAEQCISSTQVEELLGDQVLEEEVRAEVTAGIAPSTDELRAFYDANLERFQETSVGHILVEDAALAGRLAEQLERASEDEAVDLFARLAMEHSTDEATASTGGDLGWVTPDAPLDPAFRAAMDDLGVGEVSGPVPSELGIHVIRVDERRVTPFEDVRQAIQEELGGQRVDEAWTEWLVDAYRAADIVINPQYGKLDIESQRVVNESVSDLPGTGDVEVSPEATPPPSGAP